jgi:hypothetical protein
VNPQGYEVRQLTPALYCPSRRSPLGAVNKKKWLYKKLLLFSTNLKNMDSIGDAGIPEQPDARSNLHTVWEVWTPQHELCPAVNGNIIQKLLQHHSR